MPRRRVDHPAHASEDVRGERRSALVRDRLQQEVHQRLVAVRARPQHVDLAVQLLTARGTDGYETVWFYQRLAAACAQHGR